MDSLFTYFAFSPLANLWKIGKSENIPARMVSFIANHTGLELHAVFTSENLPERDALSLFREHKVSGEWFADCRAIRKFLKDKKSLIAKPIKCDWNGIAALGLIFPRRMIAAPVLFSRDVLESIKIGNPVFGFLIENGSGTHFKLVPKE